LKVVFVAIQSSPINFTKIFLNISRFVQFVLKQETSFEMWLNKINKISSMKELVYNFYRDSTFVLIYHQIA